MRSGTFTCLRQDCPKDVAPGQACSLCDMPYVDRKTLTVIALYNRCRAWQVLPRPGGMMEQSEVTMRQFDVIDAEVAKHRKRALEEQQQQIDLSQRMKKIDGRH